MSPRCTSLVSSPGAAWPLERGVPGPPILCLFCPWSILSLCGRLGLGLAWAGAFSFSQGVTLFAPPECCRLSRALPTGCLPQVPSFRILISSPPGWGFSPPMECLSAFPWSSAPAVCKCLGLLGAPVIVLSLCLHWVLASAACSDRAQPLRVPPALRKVSEMATHMPQRVLVTGSNRGIGLELVKQLVGKNNRPEWIFATCRDPEGTRAQELKNLAAKHQGVVIVKLDVSDPSSIKAAAAQVTEQLKGAGLNLLINNAGIARLSTVESETPENMSEVYQTNVIGPMLVSQAFLPLLRKASQESSQKGLSYSKAAIVNLSSAAGALSSLLGWNVGQCISYRCSKAALNMLTRCMSLGFAEDEILCVALHPGWVQTDMGNKMRQAPMTLDGNVQSILNTLSHLSEKENGTFVDWNGDVLPW